MPRPKGLPKTGGRVKGIKSKKIAMREAVWEAFGELGGIENLVKWAKANESDFYKLAAKLMPAVEAKQEGDVHISINLDAPKRELAERIARRLTSERTGVTFQ